MKKILFWFMQSRFYNFFLNHILPFIRFSVYYTKFPGHKFYTSYSLLKPGMFLVSIDRKKLASALVGGDWSHAAFCVSKDGVFEIAEMTHKDFTKSTFFDFCKESDDIAIYEILDLRTGEPVSELYNEMMIDVVKNEMSNAKYDNQFKLGIQALYCSELVYLADFNNMMGASLEDKAGLGRPYISPTGLTKAKNVRCVFDSRDKL